MPLGYTAGATLVLQRPFTATVTFTSVNSGTNFPSGSVVVVAVCWYVGTTGQGPTTVTIGGVTATQIFSAHDANVGVAFYYAVMPSAETDTVVLTDNTSSWNDVTIAAAILTGAASTPTDNGSNITDPADPQGLATGINLPTGGVGIAANCVTNQSSTNVPTWVTTGNSAITASGGDITSSEGSGHFTQLTLAHSTTANAAWVPQVNGSPAYSFTSVFGAITWAASAGGGGSALASIAIPRKMFLPPKRKFYLR